MAYMVKRFCRSCERLQEHKQKMKNGQLVHECTWCSPPIVVDEEKIKALISDSKIHTPGSL